MSKNRKRGRPHRPASAAGVVPGSEGSPAGVAAPAPDSGVRQSAGSDTAKQGSGSQDSPAARRAMFRFVTVFLVSAVALFLVYWVSDTTGRFEQVNRLNAMLSGAILQVLGISNTRVGSSVQFTTGGMKVISECSGVYVAILFSAGVLAFPAAWRARLTGLFFGILAIFAINVLRLVTLGAIIARKRDLLPLFHEYLWQVLFILVVAGLYLLWIERMVPREQLDPAT